MAADQTEPGGAPLSHHQPPLSVGRKVVFSLGDHVVNLSLSALSLVLFFFLTKYAGLSPLLVGVLAWLARFVDAVSDPLMGRISDGTRWKMGRRRPYFLLGALPFGIFFCLLWQTPFQGQASMFAYYLTVYIGLSLSTTVLSVPYMSLIPEMATDYDERTRLNAFRSAAAVIGTAGAAVMIDISRALGEGAEGFARAGALFAVWMVIVWPLVFKASSEQGAPPTVQSESLWQGLLSLKKHRNYVMLCTFYLCARISVDVLGLAVPLFLADWLGREGDIGGVLLSMLGVVVLSLPFWLRVTKRTDKHRIFSFGCIWFVVCLGLMGLGQPEWPRWMMFAIAGLLGIGYAVADLMPWAMLGEVIDEDELLSGERREGIYTGVFTFLRKLGGATAYALAGLALEIAGYGGNEPASPAAATTIRILTTAVPAVFLIAAAVIALRYPLGRARHVEILEALDARQRAGATAGTTGDGLPG
jgi:sugar (glycoside-pentoside-hexuronide) transporter